MTRTRASFLTVTQNYALEVACRSAVEAFTDLGGIYHVGSSIERADWRDVDLRCILDDESFDRFVGSRARRHFLNVTISEWIAARTALPIDFQFQRRTDANKEFAGRPRSAVGLWIEHLVEKA